MNITDGYYEFVGRKTTVYIAHMRNMVLIYWHLCIRSIVMCRMLGLMKPIMKLLMEMLGKCNDGLQ